MRTLSLILLLSAAASPAFAQQAGPPAQQLHLRMLTWPDKVATPGLRQASPQPPATAPSAEPAPVAVQTRSDPAWSPAYRPVPHGRTHLLGEVTPAQQAAIDAQRAQDRAAAAQAKAEAEAAQKQAQIQAAPLPAPTPPAALPTSIYSAPPPAQAAAPAAQERRMAAASPYDQKARFYSLHRAFGERPDPISLSPQFLSTPSADLADPPPPPPPRILPGQTATAAQQTAARVQARDGASEN